MDPVRFDDRVAIVTGAGRGIGRAHALALASRGAAVVVNDLGTTMEGSGADSALASQVAAEIEAAGGDAIADGGDISDPRRAQRLVDLAVERFGQVDIVINNAGVLRWTGFPEADLDEFRLHLDVHVVGSFNVTRAAWPRMAAQGRGRVVMTTSSAVFGGATVTSYGTAKAGVLGLTFSLAAAGEPSGIFVNAVAPAAETRIMSSARAHVEEVPEGERQHAMDPSLVASVVAYLAHDECPVNGQVFTAGGGRAARLVLAESPGYTAPDLTPEDLRDHWSEVTDLDNLFVPRDTGDYVGRRQALIDEATRVRGARP